MQKKNLLLARRSVSAPSRDQTATQSHSASPKKEKGASKDLDYNHDSDSDDGSSNSECYFGSDLKEKDRIALEEKEVGIEGRDHEDETR